MVDWITLHQPCLIAVNGLTAHFIHFLSAALHTYILIYLSASVIERDEIKVISLEDLLCSIILTFF